jgi:hypothetical protein
MQTKFKIENLLPETWKNILGSYEERAIKPIAIVSATKAYKSQILIFLHTIFFPQSH